MRAGSQRVRRVNTHLGGSGGGRQETTEKKNKNLACLFFLSSEVFISDNEKLWDQKLESGASSEQTIPVQNTADQIFIRGSS